MEDGGVPPGGGVPHTSFIRAELSWATRCPTRCSDTVTALCRFTAHGDFMPSSSFRTTSEGTPRIVEVTGAKCRDGNLGNRRDASKKPKPRDWLGASRN